MDRLRQTGVGPDDRQVNLHTSQRDAVVTAQRQDASDTAPPIIPKRGRFKVVVFSSGQRNTLFSTTLMLRKVSGGLNASGNPRKRLSVKKKQQIHQLIQAGNSYSRAAKVIGCSTKTLQREMGDTGGVFQRKTIRSYLRLSLAEREEISVGLKCSDSMRSIAKSLGRAPSTISREIRSGGGTKHYRAWIAENRAVRKAARPKKSKLSQEPILRHAVERMLVAKWSPQQISRSLVRQYPAEPRMHVSHETIYRSLYVQARGSLSKELSAFLRTTRPRRPAPARIQRQGKIPGKIMISERPPEVEDRAVPGHWEGDLIVGRYGRSAIGTLVERHSRFVILSRLPQSRTASEVCRAMGKKIRRLSQHIRQSITWDQGKEMSDHQTFTMAHDVALYFCDPGSPWQRGTNENTNGLLRQYFLKGTDLSKVTERELVRVAKSLNERPRRTLNWETPAAVFAKCVAMTT